MAIQLAQSLAALLILLLVIAAFCLCSGPAGESARAGFRAGPARARAVIKGVPGSPVRGLVEFAEVEGGRGTAVRARLTGLAPGVHGFHIHEKGDTRDRCEAAGPHYNPHGHLHGGPRAAGRHVGDLGNIIAGPDGVALYSRIDPAVFLRGPFSVVGRAVVVHERPDDYGLGGTPDSLQTGSAGPRVGCGVISAR